MIDKKTQKRLAKMAELRAHIDGPEEDVPPGTFSKYCDLQEKVKPVVGPVLKLMIDAGLLHVDLTLDGSLGDLDEFVPRGNYKSVALEICDFFNNGGLYLMANNVAIAVPYLKSDGSPNVSCGLKSDGAPALENGQGDDR